MNYHHKCTLFHRENSAARKNRQKRILPFFAMGTLCFAVFTSGCSSRSEEEQRHVFSPVHKTSTSRVWMPPAGGQTIRPPVLMGDVYSLWSPLSPQERQQAHVSPKVARFQSSYTSIAWLPSTEVASMQDYLFRLVESRRAVTHKALQRANAHLPVIMEGIRAQNLPMELAALPLVESAFEPGAVSSAGAVGIWQLMPATARRFGLTVTNELDERFDVDRATVAATAYLAYLYQLFGDWPLALAAYNYGEGNMQRAVDYTGEHTLEGMMRWMAQDASRPRVLPEETRRFVPSFAAAVVLLTQTDTLGITASPMVRLPHQQTPPLLPKQRGMPVGKQQERVAAEDTALIPGTNAAATAAPANALAGTPRQTAHPVPPPAPSTYKKDIPVQAVQLPPAYVPPSSGTAAPAIAPTPGKTPLPPVPGVAPGFNPVIPPVPPKGFPAVPPTAAGNAAPTSAVVAGMAPRNAPLEPGQKGSPAPSTPQASSNSTNQKVQMPARASNATIAPTNPPTGTQPVHIKRTYEDATPAATGAAQRRLDEKYIFQPNQTQTTAGQGGPMPTKPLRMETQQKPVPPATTAPASAVPARPAPALQPKPAPPPAVSPAPVVKTLLPPASSGSTPKLYTSPFPQVEQGARKETPKPTGKEKNRMGDNREPAQSKRVQ